jgi:hypothetical protein
LIVFSIAELTSRLAPAIVVAPIRLPCYAS